jgi:small-conductance mechanosensitive channel
MRVSIIFACIIFIDKFVSQYMKYYGSKMEFFQTSQSIIIGLVRAVIIGLAALIFLDSMGISITPLLASLGIGSLAVALALQDTLANFFSGIQIIIDKSVQVGQFVKLESGEQGFIDKIGWRSVRIRMLQNNMVIIPNAKLINSIVTNYHYPDKELAVTLEVGVSYDSDLKKVERITSEVGKEIMKTVAGGIPDFEPFIRYHTFGDSSINFTVILRGKEFTDAALVKHEFIKALHECYKKEGISIPFPIRTLEIKQDDVRLSLSRKQ